MRAAAPHSCQLGSAEGHYVYDSFLSHEPVEWFNNDLSAMAKIATANHNMISALQWLSKRTDAALWYVPVMNTLRRPIGMPLRKPPELFVACLHRVGHHSQQSPVAKAPTTACDSSVEGQKASTIQTFETL